MKILNMVLLVILLSSILTANCLAGSVIKEDYQVELSTVDGEIKSLLSDESSTLVYFTGWGCRYCHVFEEKVMLELFQQLTQKEGIDVVIVVYGDPDEFGDYYKMNSIPVFLGTLEVREIFDLKGVPSFYLISSNKKEEWSMVGFPIDGDINYFTSLWSHLEQKKGIPSI